MVQRQIQVQMAIADWVEERTDPVVRDWHNIALLMTQRKDENRSFVVEESGHVGGARGVQEGYGSKTVKGAPESRY